MHDLDVHLGPGINRGQRQRRYNDRLRVVVLREHLCQQFESNATVALIHEDIDLIQRQEWGLSGLLQREEKASVE